MFKGYPLKQRPVLSTAVITTFSAPCLNGDSTGEVGPCDRGGLLQKNLPGKAFINPIARYEGISRRLDPQVERPLQKVCRFTSARGILDLD